MAVEPMEVEVTLTTLVYGGDAMGRMPDGRAVFIPYVLPGETIRAQIVEQKRAYARAVALEILKPSPERIAPRCKHFTDCGGCHYQNLPYEKQLVYKQEIVRDQLTRIGGFSDLPLNAIVPSPLQWKYRNSIQFHINHLGRPGFQASGSHRVVPVEECYMPQEGMMELLPQLELEPGLPVERMHLRMGSDGEALMALESETGDLPEMEMDLPISAVHLSPSGAVVLAGDDHITLEVCGRPFNVSAGSFFQVNTDLAGRMVEKVVDLLALKPGATVLDVYCGVGLFSAFIAPKAARCIGIELSQSACDDYAENLDEFDNVELYVGAAEEILPALDVKPDAVLVDPPRSGLEKPALEAILAMQPERIVYVSCDPSTLARDAKRMAAAGYRLAEVTPFDMFPQTYHVETIIMMTICGSEGKAEG